MCGKRFVKYSSVLEHDVPDESKLIGDHIIPIELGGAMWDMDNIQTLCIDCNKIKTKEDISHITVHRSRVKRWHEKTDKQEELINVSLLDKWF
jgi:5-methylcytosine-specific restriction endonuclease McrA